MSVHPTNIIQAPDFAVKIVATMSDGQVFCGTGFAVTHRGEDWLITCRHNIELEEFNFAGQNDLGKLQVVRHGELDFDDTRKVVGVRINGQIVDAVAIELREGEYSRGITPGFDTGITICVEGEDLPATVTIYGPAPEHHSLSLTPIGYLAFQGYSGGEEHSTTLKGAEIEELPGYLEDWMIRFIPGPAPGFSGGPVLRLTNECLSLLGITTHRFPARFNTSMSDGRVASIELSAGAAVPIAPLLTAIESAPLGHSIADVEL